MIGDHKGDGGWAEQVKQVEGSRPYLVEQVRKRVAHAVMAHVEADERQVSAVRFEVVQTLLVGGAAQRHSISPLAAFTQ